MKKNIKYFWDYFIEIIKPSTIRSKVLIIILSISIALLIISFAASKRYKNLSVIGFGVASSSIAAVVIESTNYVTEKAERLFNRRKFLRFLGYGNEAIGNIRIILSSYEIGPYDSSSNDDHNDLKNRAAKSLPSETTGAIKNDVTAASYLISLFSKFEIPVEIQWDREFDNEQEFDKEQEKANIYIFVGLSNDILSDFNKEPEQGEKRDQQHNKMHFSVQIRENTSQDSDTYENIIKYGSFDNDNNLSPRKIWQSEKVRWSYSQGLIDEYDCVVVSKIQHKGHTLFFFGGTTEYGTHRAASFILNSWTLIYSKLESEKNGVLEPKDAFTVILQMPMTVKNRHITSTKPEIFIKKCIKKSTS